MFNKKFRSKSKGYEIEQRKLGSGHATHYLLSGPAAHVLYHVIIERYIDLVVTGYSMQIVPQDRITADTLDSFNEFWQYAQYLLGLLNASIENNQARIEGSPDLEIIFDPEG